MQPSRLIAMGLTVSLFISFNAQAMDAVSPEAPAVAPPETLTETVAPPAEPTTIEPTTITEVPAVEPPVATLTQDDIAISTATVPLDSGLLGKKYWGYRITLTNLSQQDVVIRHAEVENGIPGDEAYETNKKKLVGLTSFLGATGFVTTAIRRKVRNNKAREEGGIFNGQLSQTQLAPGQSATIMSLVNKGELPQVVVEFADSETGLKFATSNKAPASTDIPVSNPSY